jgi:hypothetical protein
MIKTISAALLAVSMLAAPAFAAGVAKTDIAKTGAAPIATPAKASVKADLDAKPVLKSNPLNARAHLVRHPHRHVRHHHRFHKHSLHDVSKLSIKHVAPSHRRG